MATDLFEGLVQLNQGVAVPEGLPLRQGENPFAGISAFPGGTIPAATPAPHQSVNPIPQPTSLEEALFGLGGKTYG